MSTELIQDAEIVPLKSISIIWLLPVIAILVGAWLVYYNWSTQGPLITITLTSAEGLEAGKTQIKSRSVNIGKVESVSLNDKFDGVIVTARIAKHAEVLLVEDSQIWVVSPKISLSGTSGLGTLLSGSYIEISPGISNIVQREFKALTNTPLTPQGTPGLHITLNTNEQFAYSVGDPILYNGLTVGRFEDIYFNFEERVVYYNVFIKAPYHQLITKNTKFWDVSGIRLDLNAQGISVNTGSLETLITNGVSFGVPDHMAFGSPVEERSYFDIYASQKIANDMRYKHSVKYVVLVNDTIRGLKTGAFVEYKGVVVGQVLSTDLIHSEHGNLLNHDYKIPILIEIKPGRIGLSDDGNGVALLTEKNTVLIKQGLKAVLRTGSLLTGSLYVDLEHFNNQPIAKVQQFGDYFVIPTMSDEFTQLTQKAGEFLESINEFDFSLFNNNTDALMKELTKTATQLQQASGSLNNVLVSADNEHVIGQLKQTLEEVGAMAQDFSSDSPNYQELQNALKAMTAAMHELTPLLNQLNNRPNGLIFDSGKKDEIQPKKYSGKPK